MFVRFLCNWPPYRDGQCLEVQDRFGSHFVARGMAQIVSAAEVQAYVQAMAAIDRAIEKRIISGVPARAGRRVISEDQWGREIGRDRSGYQLARQAHSKRLNVPHRLPAEITVRS